MARRYQVGAEQARDDVGHVALVRLGPRRLVPQFAVITSPQGARDVLGGTDPAIDKTGLFSHESRMWWGPNVFNPAHEQWLPRRRTLQPLFTKKHVATFAANMAAAADELGTEWATRSRVDLNEECRTLTLRVLSRSVLGTDLGDRAHDLGLHMERVVSFVVRRSSQPFRVPPGAPTPARSRYRRSLREVRKVIEEAVAACRADPTRDAPLIRLMLDARDPATGEPLSDEAIRDELFIFMFAGHDTTATTLTYSMWVLGRHPDLQRRVADEVDALGNRTLRVEDVAKLPFTMQVMNEALRLCPPAAAIVRRANTDIVVDGHRIDAGTELVVGIYAIHRVRRCGRKPSGSTPNGSAANSPSPQPVAVLTVRRGAQGLYRGALRGARGDPRTRHRAPRRHDHVRARRLPLALPFSMTAEGEIPAAVTARI